jgi:U4/U6 small nuclear ribonucleoprotein PRP4
MAHQVGNSNLAEQVEVMELTEASQRERQSHQQVLLDIEAKKRAFAVDVPTLPHDVQSALRYLGLPTRFFGENLANIRDRLRMELARKEIEKEQAVDVDVDDEEAEESRRKAQAKRDEEEQVTKYSRATPELVKVREIIAEYSLKRAQRRLEIERKIRVQWQRKRARMDSMLSSADEDIKEEEYAEVNLMDTNCLKKYKTLRSYGLEGSQYGDARPISSIGTSRDLVGGIPLVATGSWSGTIKLWDGSSPELNLVGEKTMAHEDRIMGIALQSKIQPDKQSSSTTSTLLATASIDLTAKLWKIEESENMNNDDNEELQNRFTIKEAAELRGHAARLSSVAFHPLGQHVATTSFDHTWRLWDIETSSEVLLQDGHWKEVYGVGFHPDGSLCSTSDFGGVVQVWDLRTGKSICHFLGHAKRVVCTEFSNNGFQLATAGDDGTIKVWDLRKRKQFASVPAHSNLITQLQFDRHDNGEYLASSSFDGTAKIWSTRDWKMLSTLRGHEGKVMGVGLLRNSSIVTCGFDKTLKLWQ